MRQKLKACDVCPLKGSDQCRNCGNRKSKTV